MSESTERLRAYEIVLLREAMGLDQKTFGQRIGVSARTVRGWEGGAVIPDSAQFTLRLLRHCLNWGTERETPSWGTELGTLLGLNDAS